MQQSSVSRIERKSTCVVVVWHRDSLLLLLSVELSSSVRFVAFSLIYFFSISLVLPVPVLRVSTKILNGPPWQISASEKCHVNSCRWITTIIEHGALVFEGTEVKRVDAAAQRRCSSRRLSRSYQLSPVMMIWGRLNEYRCVAYRYRCFWPYYLLSLFFASFSRSWSASNCSHELNLSCNQNVP